MQYHGLDIVSRAFISQAFAINDGLKMIPLLSMESYFMHEKMVVLASKSADFQSALIVNP